MKDMRESQEGGWRELLAQYEEEPREELWESVAAQISSVDPGQSFMGFAEIASIVAIVASSVALITVKPLNFASLNNVSVNTVVGNVAGILPPKPDDSQATSMESPVAANTGIDSTVREDRAIEEDTDEPPAPVQLEETAIENPAAA